MPEAECGEELPERWVTTDYRRCLGALATTSLGELAVIAVPVRLWKSWHDAHLVRDLEQSVWPSMSASVTIWVVSGFEVRGQAMPYRVGIQKCSDGMFARTVQRCFQTKEANRARVREQITAVHVAVHPIPFSCRPHAR